MAAEERLSTLVITDQHRATIDRCLDRMMSESEALCVMLVDISGMLLAWAGSIPANKAEAISVLLANGFVAARQVAAILGQPQFEAFLQQGKHQHILTEAVGANWILITVFEDRTSEGIVRLLSGRIVRDLNPTLQRVKTESAQMNRSRPLAPPPGQTDKLAMALDNLFGDRDP